jgi:hypothetical protein
MPDPRKVRATTHPKLRILPILCKCIHAQKLAFALLVLGLRLQLQKLLLTCIALAVEVLEGGEGVA